MIVSSRRPMIARAIVTGIAILTIASMGLFTTPAHAAGGPSSMTAGTLSPGQALWSPSGTYEAIMQYDGNFVVYSFATGQTAVWSSATQSAGAHAILQGDGNFVVYSSTGGALWNSGSQGAMASLSMQDDGNLVITSGGRALWSTSGQGTGVYGPNLSTGSSLSNGQALWSMSGAYQAVMQADGNFVIYSMAAGQTAVWNSQTQGPGSRLTMQGDGNLVIYSGSSAVWDTITQGSSAYLSMQSDGNLVMYGASGAMWSSKTGRLTNTQSAGYPYASEPCEHSPYAVSGGANYCANYDWGPKHTTFHNDSSEISPYGYAYRNCTDFVAWKLSTLGVTAAEYRGHGNGSGWGNVPGLTTNTMPATGAVLVQTSANYGHVAFVTSAPAGATASSIISIAEYNHGENGTYGTRSGTLGSLGFNEVTHFEALETN